jgi:hypothetical protein
MTPSDHNQAMQIAGNLVSAGAILGTFLGYLPAIAALGAIVWYCIQVYESRTVQRWLRLRRHRLRRKRLGRPIEGAAVHHHRARIPAGRNGAKRSHHKRHVEPQGV